MKEKIVKFLIGIKRLVLVGVCLFAVGTAWKLLALRQKTAEFALFTEKVLGLRLAIIEEHLAMLAQNMDDQGANASVNAVRALGGLLRVSSWLEEVAWIRGNGESSILLVRSAGGISEKVLSAPVKTSPLFEAHQKGRVVVSPLEYGSDKIPVFHLSYPLDGQEGGFILAKVNLWDFLKPPTASAQELLGMGFDLELRDRQGKLLAHKTSPDPLKTVLTRFFASSVEAKKLGFDVRVAANRVAIRQVLAPGRYLWVSIALSVLLVAFL